MLTEREILDRLKSSLKEAASQAFRLSNGERGDVYLRFRENLELVYGCCRQMSGFREDTRWSKFGIKVHEARERCRAWLVAKDPAWRFKGLGEVLEAAHKQAVDLETKRTGKRGIILPKPLRAETRTQGRGVALRGTSAGSALILPAHMKTESVH